MKYRIVVLAKQVPDTQNVPADAIAEDGSLVRSKLPAVFNPEDMNALEMALRVKDLYPESTITVVSMGPDRAISILRDSMSRGADDGVLISDRRFAGSDTLATSYALAQAIKALGEFDLIFSGRQAIDGDTAQVGPQVAEKLEIPQISYAEELVSLEGKTIQIKRRLDHGAETLEAPLPLLVTVTRTAPRCRFAHAHRQIEFARTPVKVWSADDFSTEADRLGFLGSPTKVKQVNNVILPKKQNLQLEANQQAMNKLIVDLTKLQILSLKAE